MSADTHYRKLYRAALEQLASDEPFTTGTPAEELASRTLFARGALLVNPRPPSQAVIAQAERLAQERDWANVKP